MQVMHSIAHPTPLMPVAGTAEAATDEKNIRRRCYDALVGAAAAVGGWAAVHACTRHGRQAQ